jgi:hypothetical protein
MGRQDGRRPSRLGPRRTLRKELTGMGDTAPAWLWLVTIGLMPATMLLLWLLTLVPVPDRVVDWVAGSGFTYMFVGAGVGTALLLVYASKY